MKNLKQYIKENKDRFIDELFEILKIPSISAASIIAKVARDNFISKLGIKYKSYSWGENYGYGTKKHLRAIKKFGITVHHRKTFSPLNKLNSSK